MIRFDFYKGIFIKRNNLFNMKKISTFLVVDDIFFEL